MAAAYLMLRLDVGKKPPTVEEAAIVSSPHLTRKLSDTWVEAYSMHGTETYDAAEKHILHLINSPGGQLAWAKPLLRRGRTNG